MSSNFRPPESSSVSCVLLYRHSFIMDEVNGSTVLILA